MFWIAGVGAVLRPRRALRDVTRASPSSAPQPGALHRRRSRKRFVFDARLVCQGMLPDYVPLACVRTLRPVLAHHDARTRRFPQLAVFGLMLRRTAAGTIAAIRANPRQCRQSGQSPIWSRGVTSSISFAGGDRCPVGIKRVGFVMSAICPVYPKQHTFSDPVGTSHLGHKRTCVCDRLRPAMRPRVHVLANSKSDRSMCKPCASQTAMALGLTLPPSLLVLADEVIE